MRAAMLRHDTFRPRPIMVAEASQRRKIQRMRVTTIETTMQVTIGK